MESKPNLRNAIIKISRLLWLDKKDIYSIYFYAILAGLVSLSLPLGIQSLLAFVQAGQLSTSVILLIFLVLLGTFANGFLQIKQMQFIEKIEQKLFARYALEYTYRLPKLNIQKLEGYYLPELINRFFDAPNLQKSLQKLLLDFPAALIQIIFGIILLAFYHPLFIGFGIFLFAIILLILFTTSSKGFATSLMNSDQKYKMASWLEELARGIKTFKYTQGSNLHMERTNTILSKYFESRTSHFKILKFQYWVLVSFKILITAAMLILGVFLLINQNINIGQFIAADILIILLLNSIEKLIGNLDQVYESLTSVEKLDKLLNIDLEHSGTVPFSSESNGMNVELNNVSFSYNAESKPINNISINAKAGEWILLTGQSGSGKSTVLRLLTQAFSPQKGNILINSLPIKNYDLGSYRNHIGILLGQQEIFEGSLLENLTLGQNIDYKHILEVSNITGLNDFIQNNNEGFGVLLKPFGQKLAGKVRHQILLTRAMLKPAKLYLLEEPFKYLDEHTKLKIIDFLKKYKATVFIATDKIDKNQIYDQVINLD